MSFFKKVFLAVFLTSFLAGSLMIAVAYHFASQDAEKKFFSRYKVLTQVLGDTLTRLDKNTEDLMKSAAEYVAEKELLKGLLATSELKAIRDKLNITHIFITDKNGRFIRSTNEDPKLIPNLFNFSKDYKKLLTGEADLFATPIIQPEPEPKPFKFLLIPNKNRTRIIEVGVRVDFIAKTLAEALGADINVQSMALYAPNGSSLGRFNKDDVQFEQMTSMLPEDMSKPIESSSSYKFYTKVTSSNPSCSQCDKSGSSDKGEYYYILESQISKAELVVALDKMKLLMAIFLLVNLAFSFVVARLISRKLVKNIELAADKIHDLKIKNAKGARIGLQGSDEITYLTKEFDNLLDAVEESNKKLIEAEKAEAKVQVAKEVAHNLRSPIIAVEMLLPVMTDVPERFMKVLKSSVKEIKGLSDKLSQKSNHGVAVPRGPLFLPVFLDEVVQQKRIEYSSKPKVKIELEIIDEFHNAFVNVCATEMKGILSNLINNAVESYGPDGGEVTVQCRCTLSGFEINIEDKGCGIPEEYLSRLGNEPITFKGDSGRGTGLFHAKKIIELAEGDLEVKSKAGSGTQLKIYLPKILSLVKNYDFEDMESL